MTERNKEEMQAWDTYAASALAQAMTRYSNRPELAAQEAAGFADAMMIERRARMKIPAQAGMLLSN